MNVYCNFVLVFLHLLLILSSQITDAGHEVLYKTVIERDDLQSKDIAIVQYDSRKLTSYWNASVHWNYEYALHFDHQYIYISNKKDCSYSHFELSPVWCKVKAMIDAQILLPSARAFLYLDSDVIMTCNHSLSEILAFIRKDLKWDYRTRPVAVNQDGPGWSCKQALQLSFSYCLNSGVVFWIRSEQASVFLEDWWHSAGDSYSTSKFHQKWRKKWPFEQAQLYKIYERYRNRTMLLSFPNLPHLPWESKRNPQSQYPTDFIEPWCFSHWPGANCFITHHCASEKQKLKLVERSKLRNYDWTNNIGNRTNTVYSKNDGGRNNYYNYIVEVSNSSKAQFEYYDDLSDLRVYYISL